MGVEHIGNVLAMDGAELTALADPHQPSIDSARYHAAMPDLPAFADHREMLEADLVDAVVIATPNMTHVDVLLDVLQTDKHILIEKPLCTTVEDCRKVVAASEGRQAVAWVGMEYRYMPAIARLISEVDAGTIGDLKMLAIREHRYPFLVKVDDWNRFSANTGGTMVEKCCHYFDLMNRIIGAKPIRVFASGAQDVNHLDEVYDGRRSDILDNAYAIVDYAGGQRAMLDLCMFAEGGKNQEEVTAVGDLGKIEAYNPASEVAIGLRGETLFTPTVETVADERITFEGRHNGSSYIEMLHFAEAIRSGGEPEVTLSDGMLAVAMGVAAHRSIDSGQPIMMEDVLG